MIRLAVGATKFSVEVLPALVAIMAVPLAVPLMMVARVVLPRLKLPPLAAIDKVPVLCKIGVVTLVVNDGALPIDTSPRADNTRLPLALTATVPLASGIITVRLPVKVAELKALVLALMPSRKLIFPTFELLPNVSPDVP